MALPKLNSTPSYTVTIPSTGQKVKYRPYLVKEEKVLMIAFETGDQKEALSAIVDTLDVCIKDDLDTRALATFDIEYLFTQIRSKSVGEKSTIMLPCQEEGCSGKTETDLTISDIEVVMPESSSNIIELTPSISIEMKYPSYGAILETDLNGEEMDIGFQMLIECVSAIHTEDERMDATDSSKEELLEFIESMTTEQFKKVSAYLQDIPSLRKDVEFLCEKCGTANTHTLKGISDFL